jgi:paraquat-inducible protein A
MTEEKALSLRKAFPRRLDISILLAVCTILLPLGLSLPTVTLSQMAGISDTDFSVITGILKLARDGNAILALVIFSFSLVFPTIKLTMLIVIWTHGMKSDRRERALHVLKVLGKWSMLDVFVVVSLVGAIQFGLLANATPRIGIYFFSAAVLSCLLLTHLESRLAQGPERTGGERGSPSLVGLPIALLALLLLGAGLALPLMETKKLIFWTQDYSVLSVLVNLVRKSHNVLAGIVVLFVIVAPFVKLVGQIALQILRRIKSKQGRLAGILAILDTWTMIDVFALGVVIVAIQIGGIADVSPRAGLGCFLAAVFLSSSLSWVIKT